jgi:hypothetical protein
MGDWLVGGGLLRVQKTENADITFVELKILWHIFKILTVQYCATAHSLRINNIDKCRYVFYAYDGSIDA